jgi:hypothetical protein
MHVGSIDLWMCFQMRFQHDKRSPVFLALALRHELCFHYPETEQDGSGHVDALPQGATLKVLFYLAGSVSG